MTRIIFLLVCALTAICSGKASAQSSDLKTTTNSSGMEFKQIQAGKFTMGQKDYESGGSAPEHPVQITRDYNIGVTEVTRAQWEKVMETTPWNGLKVSKDKTQAANVANLPAWPVTYSMALDFCSKLTELDAATTGRCYRLPTEAEWEYACRAGTDTTFSFGETNAKLEEYAQIYQGPSATNYIFYYFESKCIFLMEVGKKKPNPWGLYDMHGNSSEWCSDWYSRNTYTQSPVADPTGPSTGTQRVLRGNRMNPISRNVSSADRQSAGALPTEGGGFRVVWDDGTTVPSRAAELSRVPTVSVPTSTQHATAVQYQDGVFVAPDITVTGHTIHQATVYLVEDTQGTNDRLYMDEHTPSLIDNPQSKSSSVNGIDITYDKKNGVLKMVSTTGASPLDFQAALRGVKLTGNATEKHDRAVEIIIGPGVSFDGHYYEYYEYVDDVKNPKGITWKDAKAAAEKDKYHGVLKGYLATITSKGEQEFVVQKLQGLGWMGGSDETKEGVWRWVTGPEGLKDDNKGQIFTNQKKTVGVDLENSKAFYYAWANKGREVEPNNVDNFYREGEDYAHFWPDGRWNDFPNDLLPVVKEYKKKNNPYKLVTGYMVEYGGMPDDKDIEAALKTTHTVKFIIDEGDPQPKSLTNSIRMEFKLILAGTFTMGSPESEEERRPVETQHDVTITRDYYLGSTEVTQSQWQQVMGTTPWTEKGAQAGEDNPATFISWNDAVAFCEKLSALPDEVAAGRVYRLPTEAEWEYACRAGRQTAYSFGDEVQSFGEYAWYSDNSDSQMHSVGQKKPNAWGLYDMHGNISEWCADVSIAYTKKAVTDPVGPAPAEGSGRVRRGGSWGDSARLCRSASRSGIDPSFRLNDLGFRLALSSPSVQSPEADK